MAFKRKRTAFRKRKRTSIKRNVYSWNRMNAKVERVARMIPPPPEKKFIEGGVAAINVPAAAVPALSGAGSWFVGPAVGDINPTINLGTGLNNRVGNKVYLKYLDVKI